MKTSIFSMLFACALFLAAHFQAFAHPAWAIVVDDKNQVYVSDLERIWKIDAEGKVSILVEKHTHEMTFDKDGNLLGEELHYEPSTEKYTASLWKITPSGDISYVLAPTETPPKGISIWKNQTGDTFYSGQTAAAPYEFFLLKRSAKGSVKVLLGDRERALRERQIVPYSLGGMAFAADGTLFVKNSSTVWKVAPGDRVSIFADKENLSPTAPDPMLFGIAIDEGNNVYTADFNNKKILKIAPDKSVAIAVQSETGWSPTGVYYRNKNLYVLEGKDAAGGVRVQKISPDGRASTVATIGGNSSNSPNNSNNRNSSNTVYVNRFQSTGQSTKTCLGIGLIIACVCFVFRRK
ncbi:MAG TPA: hypothetical protein VF556_05865 [Pyrinomonadaceae bacterium]|jgi:hypothetical protein